LSVPALTDADFFLDGLDTSLFPGVSSSIQTHNGFGEAQARSASAVLAAVKKGFSTYSVSKVTVIGHSLGTQFSIITTTFEEISHMSYSQAAPLPSSAPRTSKRASPTRQ
jgi:hypothetical protein